MTEFLVRHFIKDYHKTEELNVRTQYGTLAGVVGIICNALLFAVKAAVGIAMHSISVTADAFNNLSDAASSVIGLVGVKLAGKPADKEHPFGHGRMEYITALVVSFLVIEVGLTFFKDAFSRIWNPQKLEFQFISVLILVLSIGVKLWMSLFNRKLGKRIDSKVMLATAADAVGDVITTSATVISLLFFYFTGINIDGVIGVCVSLVVIWAGIGIAKDTLKPLLGEPTPSADYEKITRFVESYDGIIGSHDLIVHNYGPGRNMASIHAEVPNDVDIEESHEIIDRIERDAISQIGVFLVIHMDPVETKNERILEIRKQVEASINEIDPDVTIHDLRVVEGKERINLIFDMVVPFAYSREEQKELERKVRSYLSERDSRYQCVITVEQSFVAQGEEG
ncbi:cation diffusion facilitator family transporter [Claveliimonas bilis]|uniref:cation diffusion facilitator family transporter n=1 Tax=Claveliimonas bilis TaxID=3028070 RepID=UPI00292E01C8|nr:cation diffusion facilitator family transporter [Claveliimonas bilis]BDZ79653.1 cation diffusion facilitator transporter [Claveliimonas bilis]